MFGGSTEDIQKNKDVTFIISTVPGAGFSQHSGYEK